MSYALSPEGLRKIDEFVTSVYQNYNAAVGSKFSVEPSVVQSIFKKPTLDGAWFLNLINPSVPVKELTGEKLGMGLTGLISSRKKTSIGNERQAKQFHSLDKEGFQLVKRNFDWGLAYEYIDKWRHLAGEMFAKFYGDLIAQAYVNETLLIGWNGTSIAEETDPVANPLGQDMNIGWFQKLRDHAPGQIIDDPVTIGATGDFKNLDSLINEMRFGQAEVFRENSANRALISSDLIGASTGRYYESSGDTPSEKSHLNNGRIIETFGGLQSLVPPFMPSKAVMVTPPKNISIYHQEGSWRRQILNEPKLDQFSDFNSVNEGFLLEENTAAMVFTNVSFLE